MWWWEVCSKQRLQLSTLWSSEIYRKVPTLCQTAGELDDIAALMRVLQDARYFSNRSGAFRTRHWQYCYQR